VSTMLPVPLYALLALTVLSSSVAVDLSICTFESDTCGWRLIDGDIDFHWQHGSSLDTTFLTIDHTFSSILRNGLFVFIEESNIISSGQNGLQSDHGVLESVQLTPSDNVCSIRFAYYCIGSVLSVNMNGNILKSLSCNLNTWRVDIVPINITKPSIIQFVVRESSTSIYLARVALDDIQFIPCTCK
jgi:hypothetical protein